MQYIRAGATEQKGVLEPSEAEATLAKHAPAITLGLLGAFVLFGGLLVLTTKRR